MTERFLRLSSSLQDLHSHAPQLVTELQSSIDALRLIESQESERIVTELQEIVDELRMALRAIESS